MASTSWLLWPLLFNMAVTLPLPPKRSRHSKVRLPLKPCEALSLNKPLCQSHLPGKRRQTRPSQTEACGGKTFNHSATLPSPLQSTRQCTRVQEARQSTLSSIISYCFLSQPLLHLRLEASLVKVFPKKLPLKQVTTKILWI